MLAYVYPRPEFLATLARSSAVADHVKVDFELRGCPISKRQLLEVVTAALAGRRPETPGYSVCVECKRRGTVCVLVARGTPCMGPITQAGCGAICPSYARGCYGCFGPSERPNPDALAHGWGALGASPEELAQAMRSFNGWAPAFREGAERLLQIRRLPAGAPGGGGL
jgi:coenzyme F420-reducing hydrogenase gamma subunit